MPSPSARTHTVHLPSGLRVRVRAVGKASTPHAERGRQRALWDDTRALLQSGGLSVEDAATRARLDDAAIDGLSLSDFHVLRDFAIRSGLVESEPEDFPCDNCDAPLTFDGASLSVDDLDDRYRGETESQELSVGLPQPIETSRGVISRVQMKAVTLREAMPLLRELARDRPFRITPALVRAMGIVRLEGKAKLDEPRAVARALDDASDESWSAVEAGFLTLAYPARAVSTLHCPSCDTVHELEVPWPRELEPSQYQPRREASAAFPTAEAFEDHVERVAGPVFERMGVTNMTLRVEPGVPDVDGGGVPMLGSYGPETADDGRTEFVVTLYFRTFERSFREDPRFDWQHEVEETLEHEVQHHLYYLDGHDPMDEAERKETEGDAIRRAGGRDRLEKLERAALARDAWAIVRTLGPLLLVVALGAALFLRCS